MTLDEAIKHAEEEAEQQDKLCKRYDDASGYTRSHNEDIRTTEAKKCVKRAEEHRQIAEWLKELKQLREKTRWTPVSEELPKNHNQEVLISLEWGIDIGRYSDGEWHSEWINHYDDGNVLAWMLLPEPYKAESEDEE